MSECYLMIHDPYFEGFDTGDVDDILAMLTAVKLYGNNNVYVYIPHHIGLNNRSRFDIASEKMTHTGLKFINRDSFSLLTIVNKAKWVGMMAPLSKDDSLLVSYLDKRRDNSKNFVQGGMNDYNLKNSYEPNKLLELFPMIYESNITAQKMSVHELVSILPSVNAFVQTINDYSIKKCICVPSYTKPFAAGLYCPGLGKANNLKATIQYLKMIPETIENRNLRQLIEDVDENDDHRLREFMAALPSVLIYNCQEKTTWAMEYSKQPNVDITLSTYMMLEISMYLVSLLRKAVGLVNQHDNVSFNATISVPNSVIPICICYDMVAVLMHHNDVMADNKETDLRKLCSMYLHDL